MSLDRYYGTLKPSFMIHPVRCLFGDAGVPENLYRNSYQKQCITS
jgi:hypothetical protein